MHALRSAGLVVLAACGRVDSPVATDGQPLAIGADVDEALWDGVLDDIQFYDRVLTRTELCILAEAPAECQDWDLQGNSC